MARPHGTPLELERIRRLAVQRAVDTDLSLHEIAQFVGVTDVSMWRWVTSFGREGDTGITAHPPPGRPHKLTRTQEKIVGRWLKEKPSSFGFDTDLWTARRLCQVIVDEFGIQFHPHYLPAWLRERNFTPQKPLRVARERDPKQVADWLHNRWPSIKRKAAKMRAYLALMDDSGLHMAPLVRRSWAPRGERPIFHQQGRGQKVSITGALVLTPKRDRIGLFFQTLINDYFDNLDIASFLEALLRQLRRPLLVVWDRGTNHTGEGIREVEELFGGRIILETLPAYAPILNPVEIVWGWLKYDKLCNFAPHDVWELDKRIHSELSSIQHDRPFLHSLWRQSELPLPITLLS